MPMLRVRATRILRADGLRIAQHHHCASSDCKRRCIPETAAQIGMEKIS